MNDREKLIDLLCHIPGAEEIADFFLANGVTFQKWIPVSERLPNIFGEFNVVVKRNSGEIYSDYADFNPFTKRWTTGLFF